MSDALPTPSLKEMIEADRQRRVQACEATIQAAPDS